jgi:putative ABC transport system permease protein
MVIIFFVSLLLTGLYPAFVLSGFKPVEILKGKWRHSSSGVFFRKSLTVVQFVITGCLVTGALVIYSQMKYINDKDLGFSKQQIITIGVDNDSVTQRAVPSFRHEVESIVGQGQVRAGSGIMGEGMAMSTTFAETENGGKRELMSIYQFVDKEFIPLLNIRIKEGRNITDSFRTDQDNAFIVNEAFVTKMGWKKALGKTMDGFNRKGKVVGVIKNYFFKSLHNAVEPIVILYNNRQVALITVKTDVKNISRIAEIWKAHFPSQPFQYDFLDEALAEQYTKDKTTQTLFTYFTFFAIFISAMGLYGLVSLMAVQRRKEISVRKVLGASLTQLITLLSKGFLILILIASVLAIPLSWYAMNKWLLDYAYHISLQWWMFTIPVVLIIFVALIVVSQQIFKAALENPVNSLRSE